MARRTFVMIDLVETYAHWYAETYATLLRSQVLTDEIASKPLADLKPSHVEQLAVRMRVKGCKPVDRPADVHSASIGA
jgi:hypothetical protein